MRAIDRVNGGTHSGGWTIVLGEISVEIGFLCEKILPPSGARPSRFPVLKRDVKARPERNCLTREESLRGCTELKKRPGRRELAVALTL